MRTLKFRLFSGLALLSCSTLAFSQLTPQAKPQPKPEPGWTTVVNNGGTMPGTQSIFNSYNQPSVNVNGTVVFRARSKGGSGTTPIHGIYLYTVAKSASGQLTLVFDKTSLVPPPNNNGATFIEFPSFPRIDLLTDSIVTRGTSQPVLTYLLDGADTKAGTSGVYVERNGKSGKGTLTAASQLGSVPGYSLFAVPGAESVTKFDQFPGAPSISDNLVVFKGNYTESTSKTGIYFRDIAAANGLSPVQRIADTSTYIPGTSIPFGATAPPSAALGKVVFTGWDNEEAPTAGGIYLAPISPDPQLTTLVSIGGQVPGEAAGTSFTNVGESLGFDGRYVVFWGSWGSETRAIHLTCPVDGNKDVIDYCIGQHPDGFDTTVPLHQGIFVYDTLAKPNNAHLWAVAKTTNGFDDFVYWVFSGKVPGTEGSDDGEPARWRSSSFAAISSGKSDFRVVFKGKNYGTDSTLDGIYTVLGPSVSAVTALMTTNTDGTTVDPQAPGGSKVVSLGIERDGYRGEWLAVTAGMLNSAGDSWAGVYVINLKP